MTELQHAPLHYNIRSRNLREFRDTVSDVLHPYEVKPAASSDIDAKFDHWSTRNLSFSTFSYGAPVEIDAGVIDDFYLLQIPLRGSFTTRIGGSSVDFSRGAAQLLNCGQPLWMRNSPDCQLLIVWLERAAVHEAGRSLLGWSGEPSVDLGSRIDLHTTEGGALWRTADFVRREFSRAGPIAGGRAGAQSAQALLLATLFAAAGQSIRTPHSETQVLPFYVRRAETFMRAHLAEDISLAEIAGHAGVSTRTLQYGFNRSHGLSPMAFLKACRLDRVHAELRAARPGRVTVTEIAMNWGFSQFGRFAADYRARFGVSPSESQREG